MKTITQKNIHLKLVGFKFSINGLVNVKVLSHMSKYLFLMFQIIYVYSTFSCTERSKVGQKKDDKDIEKVFQQIFGTEGYDEFFTFVLLKCSVFT